MGDLFDYLAWRGDVSFTSDPFNEVDNLILAELAYTDFEGIVPPEGSGITLRHACEMFFETHSRLDILESSDPIVKAPLLMEPMLEGSRLGSVILSDHINIVDNERDVQISALTYRLSDGTAYIAFRGTDRSIAGWKEDFNISYLSETEGQRKAVEYLNERGSALKRDLRVGGHSKGGNFAVYAAAFCSSSVQDRILSVYTNDGPGFRPDVTETPGYERILPKIISIVPDTSVVGMLLSTRAEHRVVESSASGFAQHDALTWQVERNRFIRSKLSDLGVFIMKVQKDWLSKMDDKERQLFTDTLFDLLSATGAGSFDEMAESKFKTVERVLSSIRSLSRDKQREMMRMIGELLESSSQAAKTFLPFRKFPGGETEEAKSDSE